MAITNIKVRFLYDPEAAREHVLEVFSECNGNMRNTAKRLGCHYHTLLRLVKSDEELADAIVKERGRLHDAGIQQRGFGRYQRGALK